MQWDGVLSTSGFYRRDPLQQRLSPAACAQTMEYPPEVGRLCSGRVLDIANYAAAQQYHSKTYRVHCEGSARNRLSHSAFQAAPLNASTGVDERMQSHAYASARSPTNARWASPGRRLRRRWLGSAFRRAAGVAYVLRVNPHLCGVPRAPCRGDPRGCAFVLSSAEIARRLGDTSVLLCHGDNLPEGWLWLAIGSLDGGQDSGASREQNTAGPRIPLYCRAVSCGS